MRGSFEWFANERPVKNAVLRPGSSPTRLEDGRNNFGERRFPARRNEGQRIGLADASGCEVTEHRIGDFLTREEIRDRTRKIALNRLRLRLSSQ